MSTRNLNVLHERDDAVLEPMNYLSGIPGKDIRGQLIDCFQQWLKIPEERVVDIKEIITDLHNASLLVDDIEDNSKMRRGMPVAHSIFGIPSTMNCANYVYFLALEKCHSLDNPSAISIFVQELLNLHRGQGQDILWREQCKCPTEEQYMQMIKDKTGGLFRLAVGLLQSFSTVNGADKTDYTVLVNRLAEYFQIRDDFLNISDAEYQKSKSFCEDLTEGKFSFPILYSVNKNPNDTRLLNILRQRTEDLEVKKHAVAYMKDMGALDHTRHVLSKLKVDVDKEITRLGGHSRLSALISHLDRQLDFSNSTDGNTSTSTEEGGSIGHRGSKASNSNSNSSSNGNGATGTTGNGNSNVNNNNQRATGTQSPNNNNLADAQDVAKSEISTL